MFIYKCVSENINKAREKVQNEAKTLKVTYPRSFNLKSIKGITFFFFWIKTRSYHIPE